jgi:hypothetical protein
MCYALASVGDVPRPKDSVPLQTHLSPEDHDLWQRVVRAVREETRMQVSEAEVLRKLIRDKAASLEPVKPSKKR